jgi:hypothetical protein
MFLKHGTSLPRLMGYKGGRKGRKNAGVLRWSCQRVEGYERLGLLSGGAFDLGCLPVFYSNSCLFESSGSIDKTTLTSKIFFRDIHYKFIYMPKTPQKDNWIG